MARLRRDPTAMPTTIPVAAVRQCRSSEVTSVDRGPQLRELAELLARAYLRLVVARDEKPPHLAPCPPVPPVPSRQNCLDVAAEAKHELDSNRRIRRPRCNLR
jgi:hypothetical protein